MSLRVWRDVMVVVLLAVLPAVAAGCAAAKAERPARVEGAAPAEAPPPYFPPAAVPELERHETARRQQEIVREDRRIVRPGSGARAGAVTTDAAPRRAAPIAPAQSMP